MTTTARGKGRPVTLAIVIAMIVPMLLFCSGAHGPLELVFWIFIGWWRYLARTLPRVTLDWASLGNALLWISLFAAGLHGFCRWLYRDWRSIESAAGLPPRRWRMRWTAMLVGLVIFLFSAGTAAVCVAHQIGFLATSGKPMFAHHDNHANLDTQGLKMFINRHLQRDRHSVRAIDLWRAAIVDHPRYKPLIDRHHLIVWDGPDGKVAGAILFHRDPLSRAEHGIVVVIGDQVTVHSADELPQLVNLVPLSISQP